MKSITLTIQYRAAEGEQMQLIYRAKGAQEQVLEMYRAGTDAWAVNFSLQADVAVVSYGYRLVRGGKVARNEWAVTPHALQLNCVNNNYFVNDLWLDSPVGYYTQTNLFRFFDKQASPLEAPSVNWYNRSLTFSLYAMGVERGDRLVLCGDAPLLGEWNIDRAISMQQVEPNLWSATFDVENLCNGWLQFKFVRIDAEGNVCWEAGENRVLALPTVESSTAMQYTLEPASFPAGKIRLAGTVLPLFSMRSSHGWGIGDFGDIKLMAQWLRSTGQNILQLLPLNDTTIFGGDEDSYPYNCVSVYALNPIYLDMSVLPPLQSANANRYYEAHRTKLNEAPAVQYSLVYALKMKYLRDLYNEQGSELLSTDECRRFLETEKRWLRPYAIFRFLTARLHSCIWDWDKYRYYNENTEQAVLAEYPDAAREIDFYSLVQYLLYSQLCDAHNYANSIGVALKGDIPIGVAPNGVDVWCEREQFNLQVSAGAPPDAFSADGQNWGFPTYNWDVMSLDGYSWWRRRLQYMSKFFDAYRIDHVLGFFRIWEIPHTSVSGLSGSFSPNKPLSREELAAAGFVIDDEAHLQPYITHEKLKELFPRRVKYVVERFFDEQQGGTYRFKEYITGASHLAWEIHCKCSATFPEAMKKALLRLYGNVLFLRDLKQPEMFVPRILGSETEAYAQLSQQQRIAYDRIYEDYFYNRHTMHWFEEGMRKLAPVLQSTTMTACGEDLGMIPACVPWVMKNLQILSLEIQRMPKLFGETFARPEYYPYLSVATPSTHDMSTLRGWWREDKALSAEFYHRVLGCEGECPQEMTGAVARAILVQHLQSPAAFALFAWQDIMAMDERLRLADPEAERINVPSNRDHMWNYRMHLPIEDLMQERAFNDALRAMIADSGRGV
ncbi:MAG: 4-alpha-glucanotransferase [Bacteroidaceae bacterium]|nr:4-alpha-glucanotransferase [Bacteroidaceae bacterium]